MKISFLIHSGYGVGGTIRSTLNLATALADRHEVEIASVFRHRDVPAFEVDPRIRLVPLLDTRPGHPERDTGHPLHQRPSEHFPQGEGRYRQYSLLTDERVQAYLAATDADVVVGTRPGLTAYLAQFVPAGAGTVRVGQENMSHNHHGHALRTEMARHIARLDAFVTVSGTDAAVYRAHLPPSVPVHHIPNSVPAPQLPPSDGTSRIVVAAGRLAAVKSYDLLVDAFARVAARHPDWQLRIYGGGDQRAALRKRVDGLRLHNHVRLMGPHSPIDPEWVKASIAVSTSRHESFGMSVVEAMRCGLPVVSTDCDYGPREIIRHGTDGLLVPVGDARAVAKALLTLIEDEDLRHRMAEEALRGAGRFDPSRVARQYEDLFRSLVPAGEEERAGRARDDVPAGAGVGTLARAGGTGPEPEPGPAPAATAPVADCAVAPDGGLTLRFQPPLTAWDDPDFRRDGVPRLVCVRRGRRGSRERTFPVGLEGDVTVPAGGDFAEGVWDVHVTPPDSSRRLPVTARTVDQRGALHPRAPGAAGPVGHVLPRRDPEDGRLTLHTWSRPVHAEVTGIDVGRGDFVVHGLLLGAPDRAEPGPPPELVLTLRAAPERQLRFPGEWRDGTGFWCTVPAAVPAAAQRSPHDVWDVALRYAPEAEPVAVGRFLDDIVEKKTACAYPRLILPKGGRAAPGDLARRLVDRGAPSRVRVRLFHSRHNDLALNVVDIGPGERERWPALRGCGRFLRRHLASA
ncbi:glycosyltransferase family 4 protein [Streptomyces sp. HNM0574]|uniref:glycosyltransferase family 4 protein n=1 Tax=Streptomyces sp. HNM0574 TaxID=2714954 RepID=UPI00146ACED3|nr:glycosyltransferase family 4 protein [Streptomyces sp. HNM0574]NLU67386.1 glycosyltransferase family 4 protein [Streptomyces sp. HNM0574]